MMQILQLPLCSVTFGDKALDSCSTFSDKLRLLAYHANFTLFSYAHFIFHLFVILVEAMS